MNELLKKIELKDGAENNDLFYLGAALVTKEFEKNKTRVRRNSVGGKDWKVKLKNLTKICGDKMHYDYEEKNTRATFRRGLN